MLSGNVASYECKSPNQQIMFTNIKTAFKLYFAQRLTNMSDLDFLIGDCKEIVM